MKKLFLLMFTAALIGTAASAGWQEAPLEEKLIQIQAAEAMPEFASNVQHEPVAVQAVLLDYVDDRELLLKAQAALLSRPELARRILPLYGAEPEFQTILKAFGDSIFPPIAYFHDKKIRTLDLRHYTAHKLEEIKATKDHLLQTENQTPASKVSPYEELTPEQRGWYAVNFIHTEGHRFLGQFSIDINGTIHWIQTERMADGITSFFTDGIRSLETKTKTSQDITAGDVGWAAVDALIFVSAVKVLRASKMATATSRNSAAAARMARAANMAIKTGKYMAAITPVAVAYLVVRHPGIINDMLAEAARLMDFPVRLVQIVGWMAILLPFFYISSWTMRFLVRPTLVLLRLTTGLLLWISKDKNNKRKHFSPQTSKFIIPVKT